MTKILIIAQQWPEPKTNAAGVRMLQLIKTFIKFDYQIHLVSAALENEYTINIDGVQTHRVKLNDSSFDDFITRLDPSIVMYDRFLMEEQYGWRVTENCPKAVQILDSEDLHFLRKAREKALKNNCSYEEHLQDEVAIREIASIYRVDLTLVISEFEMDLLIDKFQIRRENLFYFPFVYEFQEMSMNNVHFDRRDGFTYIGNMKHRPNKDGFLYLVREIWPVIKNQLPPAKLQVYGAYADQQIQQLHNPKNGIYIQGQVDDIEKELANSKALLAPLRYGAGLKGKVLSSMQTSTPVVISSITAEGIYGDLEPNGFIEDDPKTFATIAVLLHEDQSVWQLKSALSHSILNLRFRNDLFIKKLHDKLIELLNHLESHRKNNFIGKMLNHHTIKSSKYLSKWIEEKNKKRIDN